MQFPQHNGIIENIENRRFITIPTTLISQRIQRTKYLLQLTQYLDHREYIEQKVYYNSHKTEIIENIESRRFIKIPATPFKNKNSSSLEVQDQSFSSQSKLYSILLYTFCSQSKLYSILLYIQSTYKGLPGQYIKHIILFW